ncbi:helix-turn-helix domain-containing protein [Pseudomonas sp. NPDC008258]|uniref:helix-turn-helix domain-containing protein n=1 Tax=Pseudomonas sp. NPDC008258 TaxID=3364418 RepID=UPI0036E5D8AF
MFAQCQRFNDVNVHAGAIVGWQQIYDQMSAGSAHTELVHLTAERFQVFREVLDKRVVQHGAAPKGRLCLAMPVGGSSANVFQGASIGGADVTVLHSGQEFFVHSTEGMDLLAVSVDAARLGLLAEREFTAPELRKLNRCTRLNVSPQFLCGIRKQLQSIVSAVVQGDELLESQIEDLLLECTLVLLEQVCEPDSRRSGNVAVSAYLVRQAHQMAMEFLDEPLSILQICDHLDVSRSTLQRSFLSVTGLRPVEYLRLVRLNAVRQRLQQTRADEFTIARVAYDLGFSHLGHFSGAYRHLFDEAPSHTHRAQ